MCLKHWICVSEVSIRDHGHLELGTIQARIPWPEVFVIHRGTKQTKAGLWTPLSQLGNDSGFAISSFRLRDGGVCMCL